MKMSDKELVESYIRDIYVFTSNIDGWCINECNNNRYIILHNMVCKLEYIFPDMNIKDICTEWYNKNVEVVEGKIYYYLSEFKLRLKDTPYDVTDNRPWDVWEAVNYYGDKLNTIKLTTILPSHHKHSAIMKIVDKWYDEQKIIETEKLMRNKNRIV